MDFMPESTRRDRAHQIIAARKRPNHTFVNLEASSSSYYTSQISSDEEEQDMANCLIMLSHSVYPSQPDLNSHNTESFTKSSSDNYECKTCNRAFQSFQALGGHRASHKKPRVNVPDNNNSISEDQPKLLVEYEQNKGNSTCNNISKACSTPPGFIHMTGYKNSKVKVHECSICGSEFLSGQALGGHMRRHRSAQPSTTNQTIDTSSSQDIKKLPVCLDLNLPAPEIVEDVHSKYQFPSSSSQQPLGFSATSLVDCHY